MTIILVILVFFGSIQCASSIKCYTCTESGYFCSLPLNIAGGEEHNENDIESVHYSSDFVCQSDHYIDLKTGDEKIILRGVKHCKEVDKVNHRTYCCDRNNCNKELPPMIRQPFIKCYTCTESGYFCSLPLNIAGGEEHNENDIESVPYSTDYVCQSDHYIDPRTGDEKIILRGVKHCKQVDKVNHRTYCCHRNNCNKELPPMMRQPFIYSNNQRYLPSMTLIVCFLIFQYVY